MQKFHKMQTLLQALLKQPYPAEIIKELLFSMYTVEQVRLNGDNSNCLIITENGAELKQAEKTFDLLNRTPETDEVITAENERLRKRVFVFDDYGNGVVLFSHIPTGNEKHTE